MHFIWNYFLTIFIIKLSLSNLSLWDWKHSKNIFCWSRKKSDAKAFQKLLLFSIKTMIYNFSYKVHTFIWLIYQNANNGLNKFARLVAYGKILRVPGSILHWVRIFFIENSTQNHRPVSAWTIWLKIIASVSKFHGLYQREKCFFFFMIFGSSNWTQYTFGIICTKHWDVNEPLTDTIGLPTCFIFLLFKLIATLEKTLLY